MTTQVEVDMKASLIAVWRDARLIGRGEIERGLGELFATVSQRQVQDVCQKVQTVRWADVYRRATGCTWGVADEAAAEYAADRFGRKIRAARVRVWRELLRDGGMAALIDKRGRRLGRVPVDAGLLIAFAKRVAGGASIAAAHRATKTQAVRTGLRWPSRRTLQAMLANGNTVVAAAKAAASEGDPNDYLVTGAAAN